MGGADICAVFLAIKKKNQYQINLIFWHKKRLDVFWPKIIPVIVVHPQAVKFISVGPKYGVSFLCFRLPVFVHRFDWDQKDLNTASSPWTDCLNKTKIVVHFLSKSGKMWVEQTLFLLKKPQGNKPQVWTTSQREFTRAFSLWIPLFLLHCGDGEFFQNQNI